MAKKGKSGRTRKNQLIPKATGEKMPRYALIIWSLGLALIIFSAAWAMALFMWIPPHLKWFFYSPEEIIGVLGHEHAEKLLHQWSEFGHAIIGPLELATLGTVILSFIHVIHQLKSQGYTEKTRFQPVVACVAFLDYAVEGIGDKEKKVRITRPSMKLRLRNLGDSPATFIEIDIEDLSFVREKGDPIHYKDLQRTIPWSFKIDSLRKYDPHSLSPQETQHEVIIKVPVDLSEDAEVSELIEAILGAGGDGSPGHLRLEITVRHENVMSLEYEGRGVFVWSTELNKREQSDDEQIDYIENFKKARAGDDRGPKKPDGVGSRKDGDDRASIGTYIKHSQPLQAALKTSDEKRGSFFSR